MKRALAPFAALVLIGATEPVLVPDVSQRRVEIAYSFTGAELLLFGAILYPGGRVPDGRSDIAVVLKGPPESIIVREKRKLGGMIWANADSARFRSAPSFYVVACSRPLDKLLNERMAAIYELGLGNIHLSPTSANDPQESRRFERGLVELRERRQLFGDQSGTVEITEGVLYRARLRIPARVPEGRYTAETFLIRDGKVLAAATRDIDVRKTGFERRVAQAAVDSPFSYGVLAVSLSILFGWIAGVAFDRFVKR